MVLPNEHEQRLRDVWSPVQQRTDKMELGQVVHLMIPWILPIEAWLGNHNTDVLQNYGLNTYHDF
jgi:hypothetical protein